jgi:taurine dioxygenase
MADSLEAKRLSGSLGAEVRGLSLGQIGATEARTVLDLLAEHQVLFFPEQFPTPEEHVAFGRHFGRLEGHPHLPNPYADFPEIFELSASQGGIADEWHSDITFQEKPSMMASPPLRDLCEGLSALHDASPHLRPEKAAIHPVVRLHPITKRKSLFVNEHFTRRIVELSDEESDVLLRFLTRWVSNPRFTVRYRWSEGTVAMWDNRCTQHFVLDDFEGERTIQRVTVMDDLPEAVRPPRWEPYARGRSIGASSYRDIQLNQVIDQRTKSEGRSTS